MVRGGQLMVVVMMKAQSHARCLKLEHRVGLDGGVTGGMSTLGRYYACWLLLAMPLCRLCRRCRLYLVWLGSGWFPCWSFGLFGVDCGGASARDNWPLTLTRWAEKPERRGVLSVHKVRNRGRGIGPRGQGTDLLLADKSHAPRVTNSNLDHNKAGKEPPGKPEAAKANQTRSFGG